MNFHIPCWPLVDQCSTFRSMLRITPCESLIDPPWSALISLSLADQSSWIPDWSLIDSLFILLHQPLLITLISFADQSSLILDWTLIDHPYWSPFYPLPINPYCHPLIPYWPIPSIHPSLISLCLADKSSLIPDWSLIDHPWYPLLINIDPLLNNP